LNPPHAPAILTNEPPPPLSAQRSGAVSISGRTQHTARADVDQVPGRMPRGALPDCL